MNRSNPSRVQDSDVIAFDCLLEFRRFKPLHFFYDVSQTGSSFLENNNN